METTAVGRRDTTTWQEFVNPSQPIEHCDPCTETASTTRQELADEDCQPRLTRSGHTLGTGHRKEVAGLNADAFDQLLKYLHPDRTEAGDRYESIRERLIKYFECRECLYGEDLADETIDRVARKIAEGTEVWASNPISYFYGVARNVSREHWNSPERRALSTDCLSESMQACSDLKRIKEIEAQDQLTPLRVTALKECLDRLKAESREVIIEYYNGEKTDRKRQRRVLANELGIPPNALRIRIHRIRRNLVGMVDDRLRELQQDQPRYSRDSFGPSPRVNASAPSLNARFPSGR
jgi:DNA-directed RNA polymerase specialized sigma24 family protein